MTILKWWVPHSRGYSLPNYIPKICSRSRRWSNEILHWQSWFLLPCSYLNVHWDKTIWCKDDVFPNMVFCLLITYRFLNKNLLISMNNATLRLKTHFRMLFIEKKKQKRKKKWKKKTHFRSATLGANSRVCSAVDGLTPLIENFFPSPFFFFSFHVGSVKDVWNSHARPAGWIRLVPSCESIASVSEILNTAVDSASRSSVVCSEIQKLLKEPQENFFSFVRGGWNSGGYRSRLSRPPSFTIVEGPHHCSFPRSMPSSDKDL